MIFIKKIRMPCENLSQDFFKKTLMDHLVLHVEAYKEIIKGTSFLKEILWAFVSSTFVYD